MSLEATLQEVKAQRKFADEKIDLDNSSPATLPGRLARQKQAKEQIERLFIRYKDELKAHTVSLVVSGEQAAAFAAISSDGGGNTFTAQSEEFYTTLANMVKPDLYKNPVRTHIVIDVLSRCFEDMAINMGILEYPRMQYQPKLGGYVKNKEELLALVKQLINEQVGPEVAVLYAYNKVAREALTAEFDSQVLPLVFVTPTDLVSDLSLGIRQTISPHVFTVTAGANGYKGSVFAVDEVTPETVLETLKKLQATIKTKSTKKPIAKKAQASRAKTKGVVNEQRN